jgi:hypothetical protein
MLEGKITVELFKLSAFFTSGLTNCLQTVNVYFSLSNYQKVKKRSILSNMPIILMSHVIFQLKNKKKKLKKTPKK